MRGREEGGEERGGEKGKEGEGRDDRTPQISKRGCAYAHPYAIPHTVPFRGTIESRKM